ncbi:DUF7657 domain-containing protein [Arsenicibacter rosenii]|uniref:Glycosyltransferase RgtA/B/C/D-like domain-containing protein n=1 Tax=Arsenicibacter rosenii TaxID=1750698 RepID=A0A1S2VCF0_9BACT|nr:hypothetical protein [Arsenicibacter rosenii]OIN56359.1 hypothetical protein BLX24_25360 [Arsenicibacter rosenii]
MSKSLKKKSTVPAAKPQTTPSVSENKANQPVIKNVALPKVSDVDTTQEFELIRFDKRVKWFVGICIGLFFLLTLAKIHPVSLAVWNQLLPDGSDQRRGLISGEPRRIRMDDYAVGTPWLLSQANKNFPTENEVIGGYKSPVLMLPSHHFIEIFKPYDWGFFLLDIEHGYALAYSFKAIFALISITFMLLLITKNNFWLSLLGSSWLFLSSGTQSWNNIPMMLIAYTGAMFVATIYLLYSRNWKIVLGSSLLVAWLLIGYILLLYPPYQVPLGYLLLALMIGFILNNFNLKVLLDQWAFKVGGALLMIAVISVSFYFFFKDVKPTLDAVVNTVYPGKRSESGGTGFIANWFSEYFSWQYTDTNHPKNWLNHCELSHYITFAPIIIPCALISFGLYRKIDWIILLLIFFIVVGYIWIEIGFPTWLAKVTLWDMSPTRRTQIPFGIGNVLLTVIYLNYLQNIPIRKNTLFTVLGIVAILGYMIYAMNVNINDAEGFFKSTQLIVPTIFFISIASLLLFTWSPPFRNGLFGIAITFFLLPNIKLNPVSKGMAPIINHTLYQTVQEIDRQEPNVRWVVFGSQYISYLVTATGVNLISGVKYVPERRIMNVLDPSMKRDSAYNRYAHTVYGSFINGQDSVVIQNTFEDGYQVYMDPCSPKFKKLNVKYIIFDKQPQAIETRCMKLVSTLGTIQIYRIND